MIGRWVRHLFWHPFEEACRLAPPLPMRVTLTQPVDGVTRIRVTNLGTRLLGWAGGFDYAVCYFVDGTLLIDTGFPWARRGLEQALTDLGAERTLRHVVNTHYHEDHVGNNDLLADVTRAEILAHPRALAEIRFPPRLPWYRHFLFGPTASVDVGPVPEQVRTRRFTFEVIETPGHCPGHVCLFEPTERWLFSGDLYIAPDLDSQLADANGPDWIASLDRVLTLRPRVMFDAHGMVVAGEENVRALLTRKRDFLRDLGRRVHVAADRARSVDEITRRVFGRRGVADFLSFSDGWVALLTGSDFSRGNLVRSFLPGEPGAGATGLAPALTPSASTRRTPRPSARSGTVTCPP